MIESKPIEAPHVQMLLGPTWQSRADTIEVRDPEDGSMIATVPSASLSDVRLALDHAEIGATVARSIPTHERIDILRRSADLVAERRDRFAETIAREGIKTIREARAEVSRCVGVLRIAAEEARRLHGETIAFDQRPGSERRVGYWSREPIGIVVAITPFNDPLNLVAHKVGPALAAGNAVLVKPHSATPLSALLLASAIVDAGLPPNVLQVVTGRGTVIGDALVSDPRVRMVSFTGGPAIGDRIVRLAGRKRLTLELGANSPTIVLADADVPSAAQAIVDGAFGAAGQNCLHVQRVIVERAIAARLREELVAATSRIRLGPKLDEHTDMGPLIDVAAAERVAAILDDAVQKGGTIIAGGRRDGTAFEPTFVDALPLESRLATEEVFGPVSGIVEVDSLGDAIRVANRAEQALHAAVFTADLRSAMRVVDEVDASAVIVNDSTDYRVDAMPFGGAKGSGLGREGIAHAVHEMTATKVVCLNL